jgi:hypothetical protein
LPTKAGLMKLLRKIWNNKVYRKLPNKIASPMSPGIARITSSSKRNIIGKGVAINRACLGNSLKKNSSITKEKVKHSTMAGACHAVKSNELADKEVPMPSIVHGISLAT